MELQKRKPNRAKGFDYSEAGAYFVTICTEGRKNILSKITVGEGLCALPYAELTEIGIETEKSIEYINKTYDTVEITKYVIMPNHIHLIVEISPASAGGHGGPPLQKIIAQIKSYTTHVYGGVLWQRSYHDHIIRNEKDYSEIYQYIESNPARWAEDKYYLS